ncbi:MULTISPECIES: polysaccharide pyruvyl transferase family protein [unclassified Microbacterium]|uniref:polysaccharide pyruvyl transferase family protein n=1 Tax=unclassified Microbacterium TaxID=2609290 RepID=UPI0021A84B7F|nr:MULTISPECIES: polysaccharide pyruvyl transferase family protein [unclassified Microbacterium]MCT1364396.1 polysaccharide pyruvyl transferase family protein [Microbacterium sp. p3-SID131]MCT1377437.1 polysaccharide pyruvyl transferase family protein [Microbacterium sp. p3-SID337]
MIRRIKHSLIPLYQRAATWRAGRTFVRRDERPTAFLLLTPDYGNVGDLAIGVAEVAYLESRLPEYDIVSIPLTETYAWLRSIKKRSREGDIVFLVGGGSTGDLYPRAHFGRVFAIRYLQRLPIISFPQSIIYSSEHAKRTFGRRERAAFRSHSSLRLFMRERTSMKIVEEIFGGDVGYAPDIVLSQTNLTNAEAQRSHALVVLRADGERSLTDDDHERILVLAETISGAVVVQDHEVSFEPQRGLSPSAVVQEMMEQYRSAQVVITDRLHGMIFAAVTGTPCVVLPNTNHKIVGTYEDWLRESCPYIRFAESQDADALRLLAEEVVVIGRAGAQPPVLDFSQLDAAVAEFAMRGDVR